MDKKQNEIYVIMNNDAHLFFTYEKDKAIEYCSKRESEGENDIYYYHYHTVYRLDEDVLKWLFVKDVDV